MATERMTIAGLAKELRGLSEQVAAQFAQVDARFAQIDARFEQIDARFEQQRQEFRSDLEEFAAGIKKAFKISLEGMETKLDLALDGTTEQKRRLDLLERTNADEHRLMQVQIHELDADLQSRRRPRRRS